MTIRHLSLLLLVAGLPSVVSAAPAHVHGVGHLNVAIEGSQLSVSLEVPLDAFLGFERPPRTVKEKDAYAAMGKTLNDASALFMPTAAANCTVKSLKVGLPFADGKATAGTEGHADIDADYVYQCAQPGALKGVETSLFKSFPKLYRLEARRSGPSGQGAGQLTPKKPSLSW